MFASRATSIEVSGIRKMFEGAPPSAINLGLGEPDFQPPAHVIDAFEKALREGKNKYGPTSGIPELRAAISDHIRKYADVPKENIVVTAGGTEAIAATMQTFVDRGDEVLTPNPGFVLFAPHVTLAGGTPVFYTLRAEDGFQPRLDELSGLVTPRTKAIVVNSPSNPTGGVFDRRTVKGIVDLAKDNDLVLISDEVYAPFVYDGRHESFLGKYDKHVFVSSFSKEYAMTGWRIGYLAAPADLVKNLSKVHYYLVACPATPTQYAALAALTGPQDGVAQMVKEFSRRRDVIVSALNRIKGFHATPPKGAFYAFPTFDFKVTSEALALKLLEAGVICTPGVSFGTAGESHLRFSYANSRENLERGMEKVRAVAEALA